MSGKVNITEITFEDKKALGSYLKAKQQVTDDSAGVGKGVKPEAQKKTLAGSVSRFANKKLKGEVSSPPAKSKKG